MLTPCQSNTPKSLANNRNRTMTMSDQSRLFTYIIRMACRILLPYELIRLYNSTVYAIITLFADVNSQKRVCIPIIRYVNCVYFCLCDCLNTISNQIQTIKQSRNLAHYAIQRCEALIKFSKMYNSLVVSKQLVPHQN